MQLLVEGGVKLPSGPVKQALSAVVEALHASL